MYEQSQVLLVISSKTQTIKPTVTFFFCGWVSVDAGGERPKIIQQKYELMFWLETAAEMNRYKTPE